MPMVMLFDKLSGMAFLLIKSMSSFRESLFKDLPESKEEKTEEKSPEEILASIPKHRGRKSKAELEAIAAAEAALSGGGLPLSRRHHRQLSPLEDFGGQGRHAQVGPHQRLDRAATHRVRGR